MKCLKLSNFSLAFAFALLLCVSAQSQKPNILWLFCDDMAVNALGAYESRFAELDPTPNIDWAPTFRDIAGVAAPADMQGESFAPLFAGQKPADWRNSLYYHYYMDGGHGVTRQEGVSNGDFKLIRMYGKKTKGTDQWELFDLKKDPSELNNLSANPEMAAKAKEMRTELDRLQDDYEVPKEEVVTMKRVKPSAANNTER